MTYNIRGYHGGLGDQLQFSTFPEELTKLGHTVQLYDGPDVQPFRNNEIKELVWDLNPFVKGASLADWNCGDTPTIKHENKLNDYIKNWELAHGLEPKNSLPKIYYQPQKVKGKLTNATNFGGAQFEVDMQKPFGLIELSSITLKYNAEHVKKTVELIMAQFNMPFVQLTSPNQHKLFDVPGMHYYHTSGLKDVCNVLHSCKVFVSLNSGLHSLAAAVQRFGGFEQYCILPAKDYGWIMDGKRFVYPGINYIIEH